MKFFKLIDFFSGIFSSGGKGQLILAGDPKQLGPILRSPIALKYGLQLSLLERLMDRDVYGRGSHLFMENSAKTYADSFLKYLCFTKSVYDEWMHLLSPNAVEISYSCLWHKRKLMPFMNV